MPTSDATSDERDELTCQQASQIHEMMQAQLDGELATDNAARLQAHLRDCPLCRAEWERMQALDDLLCAAPMAQPPLRLRVMVMTRLERREHARQAAFGWIALSLATVALTMLALAPFLLDWLYRSGIAPAVIAGGPTTILQVLACVRSIGQAFLVIAAQFLAPAALLSVGLLTLAYSWGQFLFKQLTVTQKQPF